MKRMLLCLLLLLLCVSAVSCKTEKTPAAPSEAGSDLVSEPALEEKPDEGLPLTLEERFWAYQLENDVFYVRENQILQRSLTENTEKIVCTETEENQIFHLYAKEQVLYYLVASASSSDNVCLKRLDLQSKAAQTLSFDPLHGGSLLGVLYTENAVFVNIAGVLYMADLNRMECSNVLPDVYDFDVIGDELYFVDGAEKTFTIYRHDLSDGQTEIVLGDGMRNPSDEEPPAVQYRDVVCIGNVIYFEQCFPVGVFAYDLNRKSEISMNETIETGTLFEHNDCLYFVQEANETYTLMKYDPSAQTLTQECVLEDYVTSYGRVQNGILQFKSGDFENSKSSYYDLETREFFGKKENEEGKKHVNNCKLVVNGQELSSEHYVYMNHEKHNVELPVLAVMRALGAECTWESETLVRIKYNGKEVDIDISLENFGYEIVPGVNGHTRKVMGDEVIFDVDSFSAYFRNYLRIENVADYENSIVYIDPMEE